MKRVIFGFAGLLTMLATPAMAHTGVGEVSGLMAGLAHPVSGLDHILAMVAVGILAVQLGGRGLWLAPASFVSMMALGGVFGGIGIGVPFVEQGIIGSVIILGAVVAWGGKMPLPAAMSLVGVFAMFHGYVHGTEMPLNAHGLEYSIGFILVTATLHALGMGLSLALRAYVETSAMLVARVGGAAIAAAGVSMAIS